MTALTTPPAGEKGETPRELAQRVIDTWGDGNPPIVILARALLSSPRVEREWCLNCGTVTRDHRCHCTEIGQEPNFVNYADELARQMNAAASSPRVEEVRREAITAQSAIDDVENAFLAAARKDFDLLRDIRKRLRSLSPQGG